MSKKLLLMIVSFILILSICSCNKKETPLKNGWQDIETSSQKDETSTEETSSEDTSENSTLNNEVSATQTADIKFSAKKAEKIGIFNSEIYGKLTVYHQEGHFLLIDEYKEQKFCIFAQGYSSKKTDGEPEFIYADMNFDGYSDFGVCYYKDSLNSYYFCFLWDNTSRTFNYCLPLSSVANVQFDSSKTQITSPERITEIKTTLKTYMFAGDKLHLISTQEINEEKVNTGAETVEADLTVKENGTNVFLTLQANQPTHSQWVPIIEDQNVVILAYDDYNANTNRYEFQLSGISPGATTVIFRYVSLISGEYLEEVIINVITNTDGTVSVIVPEIGE